MSCRIIILGKRNEGMSHEECNEYLEQHHRPKVRQIPGLYRFTLSIPMDPITADYDEMAELYFKSEEDLRAATNSDAWQQSMKDAKNFINLEESTMVTVGERIIQHHSIPDNI